MVSLVIRSTGFGFMAKNMTHGIPILVEFYKGKYRHIWKKVGNFLAFDSIISKNDGHRDLEFCMFIP